MNTDFYQNDMQRVSECISYVNENLTTLKDSLSNTSFLDFRTYKRIKNNIKLLKKLSARFAKLKHSMEKDIIVIQKEIAKLNSLV